MAHLNPRIVAKLKQIPDVAVEAARKTMEDGAQEIVDAMRALAPVGITGNLRDSIGWTWGELPPGTFMIDEIRSGKNQGEQYATLRLKIYAGSRDAYYARFHEFGTKKMAAHPFFFPAWRKMRAGFRKKIRDRVRAAIREAWRNG